MAFYIPGTNSNIRKKYDESCSYVFVRENEKNTDKIIVNEKRQHQQ